VTHVISERQCEYNFLFGSGLEGGLTLRGIGPNILPVAAPFQPVGQTISHYHILPKIGGGSPVSRQIPSLLS
jgi:hypothetical protein